jgi:prepilin-type processing-associated H-X9-DG protein
MDTYNLVFLDGHAEREKLDTHPDNLNQVPREYYPQGRIWLGLWH